ncbi:uncharacterized protein FOMMEDRAFT_17039 [Fomitiporia mediterranea MF3/22]|uniref:uncharacterized protein n=1 Tax=Fomitiporia mediterranea (strain MF3/22) TaxID=694068 RepID=UPI0004407428|nr:uncharacterized protein FOMMEDRAFT_17039 [Fomitiporia mediterranea MF3/22]EJD06500.1 hypothetical protein FOMMEDRAFT_17039 [Fomitiporia mediterranea MF3/22]
MFSSGRVSGLTKLASSSRRPLATSSRVFSSSSASKFSEYSDAPGTSTSANPSSDTTAEPLPSTSHPTESKDHKEKGYYKITLTRSAISLGTRKQATLASLGITRRMQTVFHPHSPEFAGKILAVKELVHVENVNKEEVKSQSEMRRLRRPQKGFEVVKKLGDVEVGF